MKNINFHQLDGQILRMFLVILEESSVSRAAARLELTQPAVSHALAKLRAILGDPLFVRSGQGLTPTETALSLKAPIQEILDRMNGLTQKRAFDPKSEAMHFVVAANDMQRDLIFPELIRNARLAGIDLTLETRSSGVPTVSLLRDDNCHMIVTPRPPEAPEFFQQKLFTGNLKCFFDPNIRTEPKTLDDYLAADHVTVNFVLGGSSDDVILSKELPYIPRHAVSVSNFAGIPSFVRGTPMISTQLEFMHMTSLRDLAMAPLPFQTDPLDIFMVWHERSNNDPAHKWLREQVKLISSGINLRKSFPL